MRVVVVGNDPLITREGPERKRQVLYASFTEHWHILNLSHKKVYGSDIFENVTIVSFKGRLKVERVLRALWYARTLSADIVVSQDPFEIGIIAYVVAKMLRVPLYLQIHTDVGSGGFKKSHWVKVLLAQWVLPRAQGIRVVSKRIIHFVKRYAPKMQCDVLPIFSSLDHTIVRKAGGVFTLGVVARLEKEKQIEHILYVVRDLVTEGVPVLVRIYGTGSQFDVLNKIVTLLQIHKNVVFCGYESFSTAVQTFDCLISTSLYEGYGLTFVEAAYADIPLISYDTGVALESGAIFATPETLKQVVKNVIQGVSTGDSKKRAVFLAQLPSDSSVHARSIVTALEECVLRHSSV
jgi:glycosyltransferase involved in cell wall biosynthesis